MNVLISLTKCMIRITSEWLLHRLLRLLLSRFFTVIFRCFRPPIHLFHSLWIIPFWRKIINRWRSVHQVPRIISTLTSRLTYPKIRLRSLPPRQFVKILHTICYLFINHVFHQLSVPCFYLRQTQLIFFLKVIGKLSCDSQLCDSGPIVHLYAFWIIDSFQRLSPAKFHIIASFLELRFKNIGKLAFCTDKSHGLIFLQLLLEVKRLRPL